ncbi:MULTISPECIES: stability determinant [Pseudomonas]|uniref:Stability determinant n=1 Tax=Pseudomonas triticicola TaxID=2842345 RepID=A0ABS6RHK0_9PSED|nr:MULTISPECIES: stability determinant [Pseudomonas]MBV4545608.1 stability determinant [Pseudomonas triticicola]QXI20578.1 stability determinant [Pseudomonas iranensis]
MSAELSLIVSDFETEEEAASYDLWYRAKVQAALDDPRPGIPHDEAMVILAQKIEERRKNRRAAG